MNMNVGSVCDVYSTTTDVYCLMFWWIVVGSFAKVYCNVLSYITRSDDRVSDDIYLFSITFIIIFHMYRHKCCEGCNYLLYKYVQNKYTETPRLFACWWRNHTSCSGVTAYREIFARVNFLADLAKNKIHTMKILFKSPEIAENRI